jgi:hypothetical protein
MPIAHTPVKPAIPLARVVRAPVIGAPDSVLYSVKLLALNPIAYWILGDASGTTAAEEVNHNSLKAVYKSDVSGWPPQDGIGDGNTSPFFDGTNDVITLPKTNLSAVFNGSEGTFHAWAKVAAGVWSDNQNRYITRLRASTTNEIFVFKNSANQIRMDYEAGGVTELKIQSYSETGWFPIGLTWSATDDEVKFYLDGSVIGTGTSLGTWSGSLAATYLGGTTGTPATPWHGNMAHVALWDSALSESTMASLGVL